MQFKKMMIHNSKTIERRFSVLNALSVIIVGGSCLGSLIALGLLVYNFQLFNARISLVYPGLHVMLFPLGYAAIFLTKLELLTQRTTKYLGKHQTDRIIQLCETVIAENFHEHEERPSIYLVDTLATHASARNSLILNGIKHLNAITLSQELFDVLNIEEIRAIIAHEIGHFKHYMSLAKRLAVFPFLFFILTAYCLTALLIPVVHIPGVVVYILCFVLMKFLVTWPFQVFQHDIEFLSDLYAAQQYGKLTMVNALIKLYQMNNVEMLLNMEIAKCMLNNDRVEMKDMESLRGRVKKTLSKKIYDESLIARQIRTQFQKMSWAHKQPLSEDARKKRDKTLQDYLTRLSHMRNYRTIPWDDVDHHTRDGRIDIVEYDGLIEVLKSHPELQLFNTPQDNIRKMKFRTHPTLRERILFLDANCANLNDVMKREDLVESRTGETSMNIE